MPMTADQARKLLPSPNSEHRSDAHEKGGALVTRQIVVPFEGEGSGVGELTWGQREIWPAMQDQRSSFSIGGVLSLPPGRTADDVAADLRFIMGRHASLRTRLRFAADGHVQQVVARSGAALLEVADAGDADPAEIAAALHRRYDAKVFDYIHEWPIRWAVIVSRGAATHLVSVICHIAADGMGVLAILNDLARKDPATGLAAGPVTTLQPLALANLQGAPAARRRSAAALRYSEFLLRAIPARRFAGPTGERQPRYRQAYYDSPASHLAIQAIAARTGASTSTVLLACWAVALARVTGSNPTVVQVVVNNRFRRGFAEVVSPLCHVNLCAIDVADITVDEAVARTWRSALSAYKYAYYDPRERAELITKISQERGEEIDVNCLVNDRRMHDRQEPEGPPPPPGDVRAALPQSALSWGYEKDQPGERCFLHINNVPGTVQCELLADTHYVSPADMEACLRELEAVAVEAALDPAARTGVQATLRASPGRGALRGRTWS